MKIYEGMFVLDDHRANDNWDRVVGEVRGLLEKHGARVFNLERWDERRLAYRIKGRGRAVYMLTRFTAHGDSIGPLERDCQLNDTILRVLIVRDEVTEKQHKLGLFSPDAPDGQPEEPAAAQDDGGGKPDDQQPRAPAPDTPAPQEPTEGDAPAAT